MHLPVPAAHVPGQGVRNGAGPQLRFRLLGRPTEEAALERGEDRTEYGASEFQPPSTAEEPGLGRGAGRKRTLLRQPGIAHPGQPPPGKKVRLRGDAGRTVHRDRHGDGLHHRREAAGTVRISEERERAQGVLRLTETPPF